MQRLTEVGQATPAAARPRRAGGEGADRRAAPARRCGPPPPRRGDRAELPAEPRDQAWAAVSVSAAGVPRGVEVPERRPVLRRGGPRQAPAGRRRRRQPPPLRARHRPRTGSILPEHELAIIDEAHQLEDIVSATCGLEVTANRFVDLARRTRGVIEDDQLAAGVDDAGRLLSDALRPYRDQRLQRRAARTTWPAPSPSPAAAVTACSPRPRTSRRRPRRRRRRGPCASSRAPPARRRPRCSPSRSGRTRWCGSRAPRAYPILRIAPARRRRRSSRPASGPSAPRCGGSDR